MLTIIISIHRRSSLLEYHFNHYTWPDAKHLVRNLKLNVNTTSRFSKKKYRIEACLSPGRVIFGHRTYDLHSLSDLFPLGIIGVPQELGDDSNLYIATSGGS